MPVDDSVPFMSTDRKSVKKQHWKEKLFSREKNRGTSDQQIEAFLGSTATASPPSRPNPLHQGVPPSLPPGSSFPAPGYPPPALDTPSRRWQSSSHDLSNLSFSLNPSSSAPDAYLPPNPLRSLTTRKPPRRRKHLTVKFTERKPELIGEGGDEAEIPTIEVSLRRNRSPNSSSDDSDYVSAYTDIISPPPALPKLQIDTSFHDDDDDRRPSRGEPPGGAPPSKGLDANDWHNPHHNPQDAEFLMSLSTAPSGSRLSFRASPQASSFAQQVRSKMQAEEGRALQKGCHDEAVSPTNDNDDDPDLNDFVTVPTSPASPHATSPVPAMDGGLLNAARRSPSITGLRKEVSASPMDRDSSHSQLQPSQPQPPPGLPRQLSVRQPPPQIPDSNTFDRHDRHPSQESSRHGSTGTLQGPKQLLPPLPSEPPSKPLPEPPSQPQQQKPQSLPQPPKVSLRSVATQIGESAFAEFKAYVAQYATFFQQTAESDKPLMETSLTEWIRAAVWWFLHGKKRLESYARARSSSSAGNAQSRPSSQEAKQAVLDLGKALWIGEDIVPNHSELKKYGSMGLDTLFAITSTTGDARLSETISQQLAIMSHLRSLSMSVKRNNILSTISSDPVPVDKLDTRVWVRYPFFAPDVAAVLSGVSSRSMLVGKAGNGPSTSHMMPLGDSSRYFSYGNMFVETCLSSSDDEDSQMFSMPCALSIIRDRADWYVFAAITGQSELVNILIQSDRKQGPTWDSVDWQLATHSMRVKLPRGFELDVMFQEADFKMLWNIVNYTRKTEATLNPEPGENVIFTSSLKTFQYMDPAQTKAFPPEPIEKCKIRLFERTVTLTEGTGTRNAHRGYRLTVVTSPRVKTLSSIKHILGESAPIVFGLLRGGDGAPALMLKVTEEGRARSMLLAFNDVEERTTLHSLLLGMVLEDTETKRVSELPIRSYVIEEPPAETTGQPGTRHLQFPAGTVSVIDQNETDVNHAYGPTILSEHLRIFVASEFGSVTDRINLGPGELKLGLNVNKKTGLSLYRPGQKDLTVTVAENLVDEDMPDKLTGLLQRIKVTSMVRELEFSSSEDLHKFEAAVTGFEVLFDGFASSFTISRRRMVVPIYKKWEAPLARVQVVRQEKVVQLVAFFSDFSHGKCMNFVLKGTDMLELFNRSGKYGIKIIDAKFALPKMDENPSSEFVCLDLPEYPIEHDDIAIMFDSETDRSTFHDAVPGSVRKPSRMDSLRR